MTPEIRNEIVRRLWSNIVASPDGCYLWCGETNAKGYGWMYLEARRFRRFYGRHPRAHRVMYELCVGPIPAGPQLDHLCRNRRCVRPEHLESVTAAENNRRSIVARRHLSCLRASEFAVSYQER